MLREILSRHAEIDILKIDTEGLEAELTTRIPEDMLARIASSMSSTISPAIRSADACLQPAPTHRPALGCADGRARRGNAAPSLRSPRRRAMLPATGVHSGPGGRRASDEPADRRFPPRRDARAPPLPARCSGRAARAPAPRRASRASCRIGITTFLSGPASVFGVPGAAGGGDAGRADQPRRRHRRRAACAPSSWTRRRAPTTWSASTAGWCRTRACTSMFASISSGSCLACTPLSTSCARPRCCGIAAPSASSRRASTPTPSAPRATARRRCWRRCSTC